MVKRHELTRAEFARLAGVSEAAITKAAKGALAAAVTAHGVDTNHPAAQLYLAAQVPPLDVVEGVDELYDEALAYCREIKRVSIRAIEAKFKIPRSRCQRIAAVITAAGIDVTTAAPPQPERKQARGKPRTKAERPPVEGAYDPMEAALQADPLDDVAIPDEIQSLAELTLRELVDRYGSASRFEKWLSSVQKIEAIEEKRLSNAETRGTLISRHLVRSAVIDPIDGVFTRLLTDGAKTIASRAHAIALGGGDVLDVRHMIDDVLQGFIKPAKRKMSNKALNEPS